MPAAPTRVSRREIVAKLAAAQKSNRGAAGYSRWINRRLGRQFAAVAYQRGLTPNQVSCFSAVMTFTAIVLMAVVRPQWATSVIITALLLLGYALDSADGQVARLRGGGTPAGEWLDHVLDALKASSFHVAVAVMWFRFYQPHHAVTLLIPLIFATVSATFFFAMILTDMLRRIDRTEHGATSVTTASVNPNESAPILRSLVVLPNDYGVLCLCIVLIPLHRTFTIVYAVLASANTLFLLAGCARWFREMYRLSTER